MTDIVERLRMRVPLNMDPNTTVLLNPDGYKAAHEIERLRDALWRIGLPNVKDRIGYCADGHEMAVLTARAALEGK